MAELKKTTSIEYEVTLEGSEEKVVSGKLNDGVLLTNNRMTLFPTRKGLIKQMY